MNVNKFEEIRQKISSMKFVEKQSREPAIEFNISISDMEKEIQKNIQVIEEERRKIDYDFTKLKSPTNEPLETVSFPDALNAEGNKILNQQSEMLRQLTAERTASEKNFVERKSSFTKKKSELHQKFLMKKTEAGERFADLQISY